MRESKNYKSLNKPHIMKHSNSFREDDSYYDDDVIEIQGIKAELKRLNEKRTLHEDDTDDSCLIDDIDREIEYYENQLKRYEV